MSDIRWGIVHTDNGQHVGCVDKWVPKEHAEKKILLLQKKNALMLETLDDIFQLCALSNHKAAIDIATTKAMNVLQAVKEPDIEGEYDDGIHTNKYIGCNRCGYQVCVCGE